MSLSKQEIRRSLKERLKSLADPILDEKGSKLSLNIRQFLDELPNRIPSLHQNFILGAYAPMKREANWTIGFHGFESRIAFPAIDDEKGMQFRLSDYQALEESHEFGVAIKGPQKNAPIVVPEILLIPGLGFTEKGERLGRGGGYYDRYLENYPGFKIGICFEEQLCLELVVEPHDQLMDGVITDERVIVLSSKLKGE